MNKSKIDGLIHSQTMTAMQLGSSVFSATRLFSTNLVVFAQWQDETSFTNFLQSHAFGKKLSKSWYIKLKFIRQWGAISNFVIPQTTTETTTDNQPVVAITLARMKYREIPRFLRWGRPVEKLVRDHYATTLSLASIRYPNLISTFSIWNSQKEMLQMVHGHSKVDKPKDHAKAMKERDRKDFHFEFTTLRFSPISEHGVWKDKKDYLPKRTI
ncbi:hypothetical protein ACYSNX_11895 [Myroides sp. LJL115]